MTVHSAYLNSRTSSLCGIFCWRLFENGLITKSSKNLKIKSLITDFERRRRLQIFLYAFTTSFECFCCADPDP